MKKKLFPLIALLSALLLWGCPNKPAEEDPVLTPTQTSFNIGAEGGDITINFSTNQSYTVKPSESWVTVTTKTKAVESKSVVVKVAANTSVESRKANVVIDGGKVNATIVINQSGVDPKIDIATTSYPVGAEGGTINVDVESNVEYEVSVNADWIESKGKNMGIEVFEVSANGSENDRSATVTFSYGSISKTIAISQNGKEKEEEPYINIGTTSYTVPAAGGSVNVSVSSNVSYQVAISADWVSGSNNNYTVAENKATSERTATITYSYGDISKAVTIKQAAAEVTPVDEDVLENGGSATFTVPAAGESIEVTVRTNVEYTVSTLPDWIVQTKARSVREDKLTFVVSPNEGAARNATIAFTYGELSFSVTVSQNAYVPPTEDPVLEVSPTEVTVPAAGGDATVSVNANYGYTVDVESDWITVNQGETSCTIIAAANPAAESRSAMLIFGSEGLTEFVTVIQEPAESDEDPFDVGSNLSVNGTANCYVVTKAGTYTFDASVMGNGENGVLWDESYMITGHLWPKNPEYVNFKNAYYTNRKKPFKAVVIWDDNNVVENVSLNASTMVVSFTATGNKGNALIGIQSLEGRDWEEYLWSWHIWCTDPPKSFRHYDILDNEYSILDRNLGATSANPADKEATYGMFYQFGRKDPLRPYVGMAKDVKENETDMQGSVAHPTYIYGPGSKTLEWFNTGNNLSFVTADLWGNPSYLRLEIPGHPNPAVKSELKKTIYDPCPPGYMVPPPMAWETFIPEDITVQENGFILPTSDGDSFYPFAGYFSTLSKGEVTNAASLGWFGFPGSYGPQGLTGNQHWDESIAAVVYTSSTGNYDWYSGTAYSQWAMYGGTYFGISFRYTAYPLDADAQANHLDHYKQIFWSHARVRAYPVRCMKQ